AFFPFLEERFPHLLRRYKERFEKSSYLRGDYPATIARRIEDIRERHGLTERPCWYDPPLWEGEPQMELFPV
ncbi:MAG: radical SAM protein, partial [Bryobacteraceae bacterium]